MDGAIVITSAESGASAKKLCRLLDFFGIRAQLEEVSHFKAERLPDSGDGPKVRLMGAVEDLSRLVDDEKSENNRLWTQRVHSVFAYNEKSIESLTPLVNKMDGEKIRVQKSTTSEYRVGGGSDGFSGVMAGIGCPARGANGECIVIKSELAEEIISCDEGAVFAKMNRGSVPFFLSTAGVIDIDSELDGRNFDVRGHFLSAVPVVMYIKWAFAGTCLQSEETNACLIIDDPPLKRRYGFLDFEHLNELMSRHHFTSSVAFIPWNWRRSHARVVELFKNNRQSLSLSVHGCDHTRGEFGIRNGGRLHWKVNCACKRMRGHESKTGLPHAPVMVFPQGVFSETAMRALKGSEFIGVVNSEVISVDPQPPALKISDFWNVAVMNYDSFPIFTRRYPWQGVENFAFDIMLGKPCIAVVHHNDCHDDCRHVVEFIERLNRLNARLVWRDLGGVVRRSFRRRRLSSNVMEVEMFGKEAVIENPNGQREYFCIRKTESAPEQVKDILVDGAPVAWTTVRNGIAFQTELEPGEKKIVRILFREFAEDGFAGETLPYRFKAMLRRYLCEFRDNYVMARSFSQ